jgi:hypothetical protein
LGVLKAESESTATAVQTWTLVEDLKEFDFFTKILTDGIQNAKVNPKTLNIEDVYTKPLSGAFDDHRRAASFMCYWWVNQDQMHRHEIGGGDL